MTNNKQLTQNRIPWIDVAKGITTILVVVGHILNGGPVQAVIYTFHVPTFFLLSGLCFSQKEGFLSFLVKKIKQLMLPYYIWGIIAIAIYLIAGRFISQKVFFSFGQCLIGLVLGNAKTDYMQFNLHLWFVPVLFSMQLIFYPLAKIINKAKTKNKLLISILITSVSSVLAIILYKLNFLYPLPLGLETAIKLLPFFSSGYMLKYIGSDIEKIFKSKIFTVAIPVASLCILLIASLKHYNLSSVKVNYLRDEIGNIPLFICAAVSGIILIIAVSILVSNSKILIYIGRRSLPFLLMQKFPILLFTDIIPCTSKYIITNNFFAVGFVVVITTALCIAADYIIIKYLPFLYGKWYKRRLN